MEQYQQDLKSIFYKKVHGKWILAGEHSVLRGATALVFPIQQAFLEINYYSTTQPLKLELSGKYGSELEILFWGVLEKSFQILKIQKDEMHLKGIIQIQSEIPIGAGLGASGALCVAISSWLCFLNLIENDKIYDFSKQLEDLFHGESSGVDVAVALSGKGLKFGKNLRQEILPLWKPNLKVSYSGKRGVTKDCVQQVKHFIQNNPELGAELDLRMIQASQFGEMALMQPNLTFQQRHENLLKSIQLGNSCFESWGLNSQAPRQHMDKLLKLGALAVKPTGSGDGGFVLSYWPQSVNLTNIMDIDFLNCF